MKTATARCGLIALMTAFTAASDTHAQGMTAQGYSGWGLVPSAQTLPRSESSIVYGSGLAGAPTRPDGQQVTAAFGLTNTLEFTTSLATNSWHCNFYRDVCDAGGEIRDLSSSFKWAPSWQPLAPWGLRYAVGGKDVGGAANVFKTYYGVTEYRSDRFTLVAGYGSAAGQLAPLHGGFGAITAHLGKGFDATVQKTQLGSTAMLSWNTPLTANGVQLRLSAYTAIGEVQRLHRQGFEVALQMPLEGASRRKAEASKASVVLPKQATQQLQAQLRKLGFYTYQLRESAGQSRRTLVVENTAYHHSPMDALAVAAAALASTTEQADTPITVMVTQRGLGIVALHTTAECLKNWLHDGDRCTDGLRLESYPSLPRDAGEVVSEGSPAWWRPELVLSPYLNSTLGTEVGAFDYDLALNANFILPLWKGATVDLNRLVPTNAVTDDFRNIDGFFVASRAAKGFDRKMIHQLVRLPWARTTVRMSAGTIFKKWDGGQIEAQAVSPSGAHRVAAIWGKFQHPVFVRMNRHEYAQFSYRYAWDSRHTQTTQLQVGEFWNGDRGYQVIHRFWFGDSNVSIHYRESRFTPDTKMSTFAGLSISIPLTPRFNRGWAHAGVRGPNPFSYGFETELRNPINRVGTGLGVFPNTGEGIGQTFNRDRVGDDYFETQRWRLRDAVRENLPDFGG